MMVWTMHVKVEAEPISKSVVLGLALEATKLCDVFVQLTSTFTFVVLMMSVFWILMLFIN
jgi:hypothetical protein